MVLSALGGRHLGPSLQVHAPTLISRVASTLARTDVVVFIDADYSDFPEQMDRLVRPIAEGRADIVLGRRLAVHASEPVS